MHLIESLIWHFSNIFFLSFFKLHIWKIDIILERKNIKKSFNIQFLSNNSNKVIFLFEVKMKPFYKYFSFLDFFSQPIPILFHHKEKASTPLGVFFSFCIIAVLAIILSQSDVFRKENPNVISQSLTMSKALPIVFNKNTLIAFSVADVNSNSVFDATLFKVEVLLIEVTSLKDGSKTQSQISLPLKFCEEGDFPEYFATSSLKGKLCIQNQSFYLEGFYDQPYLKYLSVRLYLCDNETSNGTCQSKEKMMKFLDERRFFSMRLQSATTQLIDYDNPFRYQMTSTYQALDFSQTKRFNIFLKNNQVNTEEGIFFSSINKKNAIALDYKEFDFLQRASNQPLFQFLIYASFNFQKNDRKYQGLTELISLLVTSAQFLAAIFKILTKINFRLYFILSVINSLYGIRINHSTQTKRNFSSEYHANHCKERETLPTSLCLVRSKKKKKSKIENLNEMIRTSQTFGKENSVHESDNIDNILFSKENFKSSHDDETLPNLIFNREKVFAHTDRPIKSLRSLNNKENKKSKLKQIQENDSFILENFSNEEIRKDNENCDFNKRKNESTYSLMNFKNIKKIVQNAIKGIKLNKKKDEKYVLKLNLLEFFILKIKEKFNILKEVNELAYLEAEKAFKKEMDINYILKRIHEFEKFKILLLDKDQLNIFDNLSKSLLYINSTDQRKDSEKNVNYHASGNSQYLQLEESLKSIFQKKENNEINKKLFFMIQKKFYDNELHYDEEGMNAPLKL